MKRVIIGLLAVLLVTSSFYTPSCHKTKGDDDITVTIDFISGDETVKFTNEDTQVEYLFTSTTNVQTLPDGVYTICLSWDGGCGGMRLRDSNGNSLILVMPTGGTNCVEHEVLEDSYHTDTNCE